MIVYAVHKKNELVYVGQTVLSLAQRRGTHYSNARKGRGSVFGAAIRKHGEDSFEWSVLAKIENQIDCCNYEKLMIAKHRPRYNMQAGGKQSFTPWNKGKKETRVEVRKNISDSAKTRKRTKRGSYSSEWVSKVQITRLKTISKPFCCLENGKVYQTKVEASKDLNIPAGGISLVLMPTMRNKSYYGYRFEYLAQDKFSLIDLEAQRMGDRAESGSCRERLNERRYG